MIKGEEGVFLALGLARAGYLSGNRGWLEHARDLLEESLEALMARPPAYAGRALAMVLRAAPDVILMTVDSDRLR